MPAPAPQVPRFRKVPTDFTDATLRAHAVYEVLLGQTVVGRVMRRRAARAGRLTGRAHWCRQIAAPSEPDQWSTDTTWFATRQSAAAALLRRLDHPTTGSASR